MLFQASQNDLVALTHLGPAQARHVARAGILTLLGQNVWG